MKTHADVFGLNFNGSFVTSDDDSTRRNAPGEAARFNTREGYRQYRYMKASAAVAAGQVVMISAVLQASFTVAAASAIASKSISCPASTFTANQYRDGTYPDGYLSTLTNTGLGQTRAIYQNSATVATVDKGLDTAIDATTTALGYAENLVALSDTGAVSAGATNVMGVAISAITSGNWGWFQVKGFCPLVRAVGSTDAVVRGAVIVPSSTAGACKGVTGAGITATEASTAFGVSEHAYAAADSAGRGIAARLDCRYVTV